MSEEQPERRGGGRPRDSRATEAILRVALELGREQGFDAITVEAIAARAGVGKTTIYRRWPDAWAVTVEAAMTEVTQVAPVLTKASARASFTTSMKLVAKAFRGDTGRLLRALVGRAQFDEGLWSAIRERWILERRKISREIVRRGMESGELRDDLQVDVVLDALYGPLYHHLLLPYDTVNARMSDAYIEALVEIVFAGIERKRSR